MTVLEPISEYQFIPPPPGYKGTNRWINWHGFGVEVGSGYGPHLLNEIQSKKENIEACIIVVTGTGGKGKTYFCLRLAEIFDRRFDVSIQVPFGPDDFMKLIGPDSSLGMGRVIIVDESQFSISNRDWYADIQKDLMKQIEAIRSKGYIIFVVALSESVLDIIARNYVTTHKIHLTKRAHGRAYQYIMGPFSKAPFPKTITKDAQMELPGAEYCDYPTCLKCNYSGLKKRFWVRRKNWEKLGYVICQTIRAKYERHKKEFLERVAKESTEKREGKVGAKALKLTDLIELGSKNPKKLRKSAKNRIQPFSMVALVREILDLEVSENLAVRACRELDLRPELVEKVPII